MDEQSLDSLDTVLSRLASLLQNEECGGQGIMIVKAKGAEAGTPGMTDRGGAPKAPPFGKGSQAARLFGASAPDEDEDEQDEDEQDECGPGASDDDDDEDETEGYGGGPPPEADLNQPGSHYDKMKSTPEWVGGVNAMSPVEDRQVQNAEELAENLLRYYDNKQFCW